MKKTILIGSIVISALLMLASLPSVVASQITQRSDISPDIRDQALKKLQELNGGSPLDWHPGLIINVFFIVLKLYIDYIINSGWFPGLTFFTIYIFLVLVILSLAG